ncbi:unnamed protein product [Rodentolepis nana]|uniref:DUF1767 domain-containing protein n=1 Tax=Rodentolepis nana TaxID=102285 RepID=A0A0R3T391_RODNA|nr:unnamed protein product [Rodentolepis nana]
MFVFRFALLALLPSETYLHSVLDFYVHLQQGLTAAELARYQHYFAIFDTLKTITTVVDDWEGTRTPGSEEVILDLPEVTATISEAAEAEESDDEGMMHPHQADYSSSYPSQYQKEYVRASIQHPNSLHPIESSFENDLIWGEMEYLSQPMRKLTQSLP